MRTKLYDFLSFYRLPTGRRLFALRRVAERARAERLTGLTGLIEDALEHDEAVLALEARWESRPAHLPQHGRKAKALDARLDRLLGGLADSLRGVSKVFPEEHPRCQAAERLSGLFFPKGVGDLQQRSYVEQAEQVGRILRGLRDADTRAAIAVLGLEEQLELLQELSEEYGSEIQRVNSGPSYQEVKAARALGEEKLGLVIVSILALVFSADEPQRPRLYELLEPIEVQNDQLQAQLRGRRGRIQDVDPKSGETLTEEKPEAA